MQDDMQQFIDLLFWEGTSRAESSASHEAFTTRNKSGLSLPTCFSPVFKAQVWWRFLLAKIEHIAL